MCKRVVVMFSMSDQERNGGTLKNLVVVFGSTTILASWASLFEIKELILLTQASSSSFLFG